MSSPPRHVPRLTLRPGVRVVRRAPGELQVGLRPRRAVVLPDDAPTRAVLAALAAGRPAKAGALAASPLTVTRLAAAGLLAPRDEVEQVLPTQTRALRQELAFFAEPHADGVRRRADRSSLRVLIRPVGPDAVEFASDLEGLLAAAHIDLIRPARTRSGGADAATTGEPDLEVLVCDGEPGRLVTDDLMRRDVAHLLVRLSEGIWVVGPFVVPGLSACLRCVDAARTEHDPRWPLVLEQSGAAKEPRDLPNPADAVLTDLALALAAAQVTTYAEGETPPAWSATIEVDRSLRLEPTPWGRHPGCGCCWDVLCAG